MNIEIKISDIFSRKNILIFFITLFVILLFNGLVIALNYNTSTRTIYYDKINIMNNIINSEGFDLTHICNAINCQEVYLKSTDAYNGRPKYVKYVNNDGILVLDKTDILGKDLPKLITTILTSDLKMYVEKDGYKFILGTEYIKEYSLRLYIITSIIIIILLAPLFIIFCIPIPILFKIKATLCSVQRQTNAHHCIANVAYVKFVPHNWSFMECAVIHTSRGKSNC